MGSLASCDCLINDTEEEVKETNEKKDKIRIKKGFATVHLLTTIIYNYFNEEANKCEFIKSDDETKDIIPILDYIILYGGSVRDLILNKPIIKDIDITINTRELTKLQLNHLQKYHNTLQTQSDKIKCIFWRHYLNKFNDNYQNISNEAILNSNTINEHDFNFRLMNTFNCNFVINAKWISEIIINSNELKNKLDIEYFESTSTKEHSACFNMTINQNVIYNGINIKGQDIDLYDPGHQFQHMFDLENENKLQYNEENKITLPPNRTSIKMRSCDFMVRSSMQNVLKLKANDNKTDNKTNNESEKIIDIELPIHSTSVTNLLNRTDFSFNNVIISFNSIYKNINGDFNNLNVWKGMVKNGSTECDSLKDIQNRIIRTAYNDPFKTIKYNFKGQQRFFFRMIKFGVRYYNEWTIDKQLIKAIIATYDDWFNHKRMNINQICKKFCDYFIFRYVEQINKLEWNYDLRFKVMKMLLFHERMINMINASKLFKDTFNEKIKNMQDANQQQQFRQICIEYKYPIEIIE